MTSVCRSSNLQALIDTCDRPDQAEPLFTAYDTVVSEDHRGTRLSDEDHHPPTKPPRWETLTDVFYQYLLLALNEKFGTTWYTSGGGTVTRRVEQLEKISIRGVVYARKSSLPRDSNVLFRRLGGSTSRVGETLGTKDLLPGEDIVITLGSLASCDQNVPTNSRLKTF